MSVIFGRKPVLEALNSETELEFIYIAHGTQGAVMGQLKSAAKKAGVKISVVTPVKIDQLVGSKNHQGVAAVKSSQKYYSFDEIIKFSKQKQYPLLLLLEEIQDPHNLGAILRTAECAGVDGIIITQHGTAPITDTVVKTSAGGINHLKICQIHNLNNTIKDLKKEGYWIVGTSLTNSKNYTEVDYKMPIALIMGNEEKGIRKLTAENCDFLVKIPMSGKVDSLNVSVAAGVLIFEILRSRC